MYPYLFLLPANGFRLWKVSRQADGLPAFWKDSSSISRLMCFMLIFHTLKAWGFDFADMPLAKPRSRVCALGKSDQIGPCHYAYVATQHVFPYRTSGEKKAIAWHQEFLKFHPGHWHDMLQRILSFCVLLPGSGWDHRPVQRWHWWEELTKAPNKSIQNSN